MDAEKKNKMQRIMEHNEELERERSFLVVKSNDLIQNQSYKVQKNGSASLTLKQQKIMLYLISKITPEDVTLPVLDLDILEFAAVCGVSTKELGGSFYAQIKKAVQDLSDKSMWLTVGPSRERIVRWISTAELDRGSRVIRITLDQTLQPYLCQLSGAYTSYPLKQVLRMRSKYSIALYEILKSHAFKGFVVYDIDDLKLRLDCTPYNITNFRKLAIDPAMEEINKFSDMRVEYSMKKTGRSYTKIRFDITNLRNSMNAADKKEFAAREDALNEEFGQVSLFDSVWLAAIGQ